CRRAPAHEPAAARRAGARESEEAEQDRSNRNAELDEASIRRRLRSAGLGAIFLVVGRQRGGRPRAVVARNDNGPAVRRESEAMSDAAGRHDRCPLLGQAHTRGGAHDSLERFDVLAPLEQARMRLYTRAESAPNGGPDPMSLSDIIWRPDPAVAERTRIARFMRRHGFPTVDALQRRSVEDLEWY